MIEKMFPQTVSNILDYDVIKEGAKAYVEDVFVQIVESFGKNLVLQSMDDEHLSEIAKHVTGSASTTLEELLDYINTDNIYREFQFVEDLKSAFPDGVEYLEFEVTGYSFPEGNFPPFTNRVRSVDVEGIDTYDEIWEENSTEGAIGATHNLMMARFPSQFENDVPVWKKLPSRRASWGNRETWMTTGGFGKPATIHLNVDEERTVIESNGLSSVENWLGTVADKLPINLYIEINDTMSTSPSGEDKSGLAGSTDGYYMSFPYEEEEGFCTNDPTYHIEPETVEPPPPVQTLTAYFTSAGASGTGDTRCSYNLTYNLYDEYGTLIPHDSTKGYIYVGSYKYNGDPTYVPSGYDPADLWFLPYDLYSAFLNIRSLSTIYAFRLEYFSAPIQTGWLSADKSLTPFPQRTPLILYNDNGEKIVYDEALLYFMYALDFTGTVDNTNIHSYDLVNSDGFLACNRREGWHGNDGYGIRFVTKTKL